MGCASSKHSSALDRKLKGTVLVAFRYKGGIVVGVESRGSTEDKPNYQLASIYTSNLIFPRPMHMHPPFFFDSFSNFLDFLHLQFETT